MISVDKVTKKFKDKTVLHNVSFEAKKGEIIGFLGPNGAGKTTTMRIILGYLTPTSGSVKINGLNPQEDRIKILSTVGYLPENNPLYPEMKVKEYLHFVASLKKEENIDGIVTDVALEEVLKTKIEELSRGYKQRVGLAAALCGNPDILILDEPTSGLDPIEQEKIRDLIKKLSKNKTIIFSTHILSEIEEIADKVIIIHRGNKVFDGFKPKKKGAVELLFKKTVANS
ncbi:MAG: ABC transporter ATP-binding protein [Patescibacteria group bacterium]